MTYTHQAQSVHPVSALLPIGADAREVKAETHAQKKESIGKKGTRAEKQSGKSGGGAPSPQPYKMVRQAHLIHSDTCEGGPKLPTAQWQARAKCTIVIFGLAEPRRKESARDQNGPAHGQLCRQHRELYHAREIENTGQRPDCYRNGLLLDRRGVEIIGCSNRTQKRLGGRDSATKGSLRSRRSRESANRESSAVTNRASGSSPPHPATRVLYSNKTLVWVGKGMAIR